MRHLQSGSDGMQVLDSDEAGVAAKKISEMNLKELAANEGYKFRVLMLGESSGIKKTDVAIENLFPDDFFREGMNRAYGVAIRNEDLPLDDSTLIAKRVETILKQRHGKDLDKKRVLSEMLKDFDSWTKVSETYRSAQRLRQISYSKRSTQRSCSLRRARGGDYQNFHAHA